MPTDSLGGEVKLSGVDMDPKTYSPMSGSDENMSSPPSVLTTASAGSCTPSSLPSAGSTPSSIQSAGSTPYQFVSQEESTIIKPLTPSDHHSLPPSTPDQPITPESSGHLVSPDLPTGAVSDFGNCKKNILSGIDSRECVINSNDRSPGISDEMNERREDCSCIMCDDKPTSLRPLSCKDTNDGDVCSDNVIASVEVKHSVESLTSKANKLPKVKEANTVKVRRKSKQSKKKSFQYQSEITGDPASTSIKIKIKLTPTSKSLKRKSCPSLSVTPSITASQFSSTDQLIVDPSSETSNKQRAKNKGLKRSSSEVIRSSSNTLRKSDGSKRKKCKVVEQFVDWGKPLAEVNGEPQSGWAFRLPAEILQKIFRHATISQGCIPFLHRVAKVCRFWREVSVHPQLWRSVDLSSCLLKLRHRNPKMLLWIIENRLRLVEELNLAGLSEAVTPFLLKKVGECCPNLRALNIGNCTELHAENLYSVLSPLKHLERLDATNVMGSHKPTLRCALGQQTLTDLAASLKDKLTHLIIANNTLSNVPSIISSLSIHCCNLRVLDLSSVETIGRDCLRLDIEKLQAGCQRLRILRLANSLFRLCQTSLAVQASSPGFPDLEELSLAVDDRANTGMNDSELERILKRSENLRLLDVRGCHNITDSSLVRSPPLNIKHLFVAGGSYPRNFSDRLELVVRKWRHSLTELDLSWTGKALAVDAAVLTLAEETNDNLRMLNLCGSSVSFEPVKNLLKKCGNLEWLNLTSCRAMPRGVKRLYDSVFLISQLQESIEEGKYSEPTSDAD